MLGFDYPEIEFNKFFNQYTLNVKDPTGQWKLIKGNSPKDCLIGALKWAKKNWNKIQRERLKLIREYPLSNANRKHA